MHSSAAQREVNVASVWKKPENKNRYRKIRKGKSRTAFLHGNIYRGCVTRSLARAQHCCAPRRDAGRKNHAGQKKEASESPPQS
jgi:hypothetical protein